MQSYQDALWPDRTEPGERDCEARWGLIAPHVPAHGTMLDVGSNLGYFGIRATEREPGVAVISLDSSPVIADRQRQILEARGARRICLVRGRMTSGLTRQWVRTCDFVELTLLLSVVHWLDDPAAVLRDLSSLSGALIVEIPDAEDSGACGQRRLRAIGPDPVAWARGVTGREVTHLGRAPRHTSDRDSHLLLVHGPTSRRPSIAYWDSFFRHPDGNDYDLRWDGRSVGLKVRGRPVQYVAGINFVTLTKLGQLAYPSPGSWLVAARAAIGERDRHGDPFPHNFLWTANGIVPIDHDDQRVAVTRPDWLAALERVVVAWSRNRTTARGAYVREMLGPAVYVRRIAGRVLRRLTSDAIVERLKMRFGL